MRALLPLLLIATVTAADPVAIGGAVPDLPVVRLDGTATSLGALRGETPLVLMAWCSSCHSCRMAEAGFDAFAAAHPGWVLALAANPAETAGLVRARQEASAVRFPVVLDRAAAAADALGVHATTTVLVIAGDGTLAYRGPFRSGGRELAAEALAAVQRGARPAQAEVEQVGCPIR